MRIPYYLIFGLPFVLLFSPIWLVILLALALNEVIYTITAPLWRLFKRAQPGDMRVKKEASIAILNWNGRALLEECLPSVVAAVEADGGDHEIIVIDNGSTDDSIAFLRERFPQVRIVPLDRNYSFVKGYNLGLREARKDILVLLNNDMAVKKDFLRPLLDGFDSADVFAVSAQIFFWDPTSRREETGKTRAVWHRGLATFQHDVPGEADRRNGYIPAFWLGGGSAAVDRKKFFALGGFSDLLAPLYMEDVDISYRAWKRGWRVLFCLESEVLHKHRSSSSKLNRAYLNRVIQRNRLLFLWENITDPGMFMAHLAALPFIFLRKSWELNEIQTALVLLMALGRLPRAIWRRNLGRLHTRVGDREVFRVANSTFAYKEKYHPPAPVDPQRLKVLVLCPYFPSLRSGGGVRMYEMIRALAEHHEVSLVSFWDEEADQEYMPAVKSFCKHFVAIRRYLVAPRSKIHMLPPALEIEFGDPRFRQAVEELMGDEDFNAIQAEYLLTASQAPSTRRAVRVITHHEVQNASIQTRMAVEQGAFNKARLALQWIRWLNAEVSLCRSFDRVVALTAEDAWNLYRYAPDLPLDVVPTGIDLEYFRPAVVEEEPDSLIFVGNFRHPPNVDSIHFLVEEVLPLVQQQIPGVKLYVVGANPPAQVQSLGQPGRVIVTGWVEDMRPYMQRSCAFVFPIRTGVGLRNKILEAWAMGKPTITTRLGGAGLKGVHGENIWFAESAAEFADGICKLLRDPALRTYIGGNARRYVEERHTWQAVADQYEAIYRKALKARGMC